MGRRGLRPQSIGDLKSAKSEYWDDSDLSVVQPHISMTQIHLEIWPFHCSLLEPSSQKIRRSYSVAVSKIAPRFNLFARASALNICFKISISFFRFLLVVGFYFTASFISSCFKFSICLTAVTLQWRVFFVKCPESSGTSTRKVKFGESLGSSH